jgi:hypothetical protein
MSLRLCAFLFFLAWIPAFYSIAARFARPVPAGLITLVAVAWGYPNYPASMPSWYNLFFATFGATALLRYLDVRRARWLFLAGVCGGVSILIKIIGAYYVAGVLLFLAFVEQSDLQHDDRGNGEGAALEDATQESSIAYRIFSSGALLLFLAAILSLLHARLGIAEFYHFLLPPAALVAVILIGETNVRTTGSATRCSQLLRLAVPFIGGVLAPVIAFLLPYIRSGALVQSFSALRSGTAAMSAGLAMIRPLPMDKSVFGLLLVALIVAATYSRELQGRVVSAAIGLGLVLLLAETGPATWTARAVWYSAATVIPAVVLLSAVVLLRAGKFGAGVFVHGWFTAPTGLQRQRIMVLASLAAMCGLVQYPFAAPIYLLYALPLALLAGLAVVATVRRQPGTYVLTAVAGFYILFSVFVLVPNSIYELTHKLDAMEKLELPRAGGLRIEHAANLERLVHLLQQHSPNGLLYAGNNCPELYFLSGLRNVTRDDGGVAPEEVLRVLQSNELKVVVINEVPFFPSGRMSPEVRAEVVRKFPNSEVIGIFHVYWRA